MRRPFWLLAVLGAVVVGYLAVHGRRTHVTTLLSACPGIQALAVQGKVAILTGSGDLWCWNPATGLQTSVAPLHVPGPPAAAVAAEGDLVVLAAVDGSLTAGHAETARILWERSLGEPLSTSPTIGDGTVLACCRSGAAECLDLATGDTRWRCDLQGAARAAPAWWHGQWWVPMQGGKLIAVSAAGEVLKGEMLSGEALALVVAPSGLWASVLPARLELIRYQAPNLCLPLDAGAAWLLPTRDGVVALACGGEATAVRATPAALLPLWSRTVADTLTAATVGPGPDGTEVIASATVRGSVCLVDATTGHRLRRVAFPTNAPASVVLGRGWLTLVSDDGAWLGALP